jgi:hypothetical protein
MNGNGWALGGLPYWTNGCVNAGMGILMESSASAPSVVEAMDNLSEVSPLGPSGKPTRSNVNVRLGVEQLQMLGIRYFMTSDNTIAQQADADPALQPVARSGPWSFGSSGARTWRIYLVRDSSPVVPITYQPTVLTGISTLGQQWTDAGLAWFGDERLQHRLYTGDGPAAWVRANPSAVVNPKRLPAVRVSAVKQTDDSISFDVNRTGIPVLVKTSYFPNWQVTGATGPYRTLPNLMIVVPTTKHVVLHYGHTAVDYLGWVLTLLGVAGIVYLWRAGPLKAPTAKAVTSRQPSRPPRPVAAKKGVKAGGPPRSR